MFIEVKHLNIEPNEEPTPTLIYAEEGEEFQQYFNITTNKNAKTGEIIGVEIKNQFYPLREMKYKN